MLSLLFAACAIALVFFGSNYFLTGILSSEKKEAAGAELRSSEAIEAKIRNLRQQTATVRHDQTTGSTTSVVQTTNTQNAATEQNPNVATEVDPTYAAISERIAAEDERRRERELAAGEGPLGESLHDIGGIKKQRQSKVEEAQAAILQQRQEDAALEASRAGTPSLATHTLSIGSIVPAALITQIRSELPGLVKAQVTEDVFDTVTGYHLLIPRGSMLIGSYGDKTSFGQSRLFVYWTRLSYPDGQTIDLGKTGGVDATGASGVKGKRQTGFLSALLGATLIGLAQSAGQSNTNSSNLSDVARIATGASIGSVTSRYLEARFSSGPKFTVPAGKIVNVMLEEDLQLPPWAAK